MRTGALLLAVWLAFTSPASAEPTRVVVRVLSQDGKFIGDHTGGARVTIRNAKTGRVLARGITKGGTGDTDLIMRAAGRATTIRTADSAMFDATVDVTEPTLAELEVEGPIGRPQSLMRVASQHWILPGEAVADGNGWLVELPGLAITPSVIRRGNELTILAKVELMCGCPITPGGVWDSADYRVRTMLRSGDVRLSTTVLPFASSPGTFGGSVVVPSGGRLTLDLHAVNLKTGNSGLVSIPVLQIDASKRRTQPSRP